MVHGAVWRWRRSKSAARGGTSAGVKQQMEGQLIADIQWLSSVDFPVARPTPVFGGQVD